MRKKKFIIEDLGAEFLVPFFPRFLALKSSTYFFKWKHHYFSKNIIFFHPNDDLLTQFLFLNGKRCHLLTFLWRLESEITRGKRNHKFRALEKEYCQQKKNQIPSLEVWLLLVFLNMVFISPLIKQFLMINCKFYISSFTYLHLWNPYLLNEILFFTKMNA